ncbi:MAG: rod shape-determining protein RodA [Nitrospirae bacterium CG18_big_fil_WC_8_21_14_2_50_70_55]|nr:rod shape-determining protein RodA [Deltaproteobacteria bacterium]OIP64750.1 MAG: rod shape-determining protein RodA [Nitrospirae bacterium CG2_30_70_394]PIQ03139.1 MAG: rod shape-determining protein RodA [Nitrospirae bacterium CG18_big_fil_WC_8_21_14_2_50_70_55]PIU78297.1 MAG: rod shape-determining protein RodA [Nitrospirae bacterium CG06_land_8_20_14_3_00_70_43]PIW82336.1 MAG: rod shape-determining protein RodA [Nitrospirae bacterium CG_4_8_14_3_um_filter_70_85]PIX83063.1 MAG: rod shape-d
MLDRRRLANIDYWLLFLVASLICLGLGAVYAATGEPGAPLAPTFIHQLWWVGIGTLAMAAVALVDFDKLQLSTYLVYAAALLLLLLVLFIGHTGQGAQRWINLGPFRLQPSEVSKLAVILALARFLAKGRFAGSLGLREIIGPAAIVALPLLLILQQPDLGTSLMFLFVGGAMVFCAGLQLWLIAAVFPVTVFLAPILWHGLEEYQKRRIVAFLKPELDPFGSGYHVIQSKIAIGSGGLWGKGLFAGTQSELHFLPEQHTDFIFSVVAEQFGFAGCCLLLLLFTLLILRGLEIAYQTEDSFGALVAVGVTTMFALYILVNVGMTTGLLPVVGVPLPFVSYGGSAMLTMCAGVGLLLNVRMQRFRFQSKQG